MQPITDRSLKPPEDAHAPPHLKTKLVLAYHRIACRRTLTQMTTFQTVTDDDNINVCYKKYDCVWSIPLDGKKLLGFWRGFEEGVSDEAVLYVSG